MKILFVVSGNNKQFEIAPFIKAQGESLKKNGVEVDYFPIKGKGIIGYFKNIKPLKKHLGKIKYDLIHAHYSLCGWVSLISCRKIPIVLSLMGDDAYGSYKSNGRVEISSYWLIISTQILQPFVNFIIVKSKNILKTVHFNKNVEVIPNGVDICIINKIEEKEKINNNMNKIKTILFLGNPNDDRKNYKLLKNAEGLLTNRNVRIVTPYPAKHSDVLNLLLSADVLVMLSTNEGSPNVIKEAMACNCPIVSTDVGDVREIIGKTEGCFITSFDKRDVEEKIKFAFKFGRRTFGRNRILELGLDTDTIAQKIINVYIRVLKYR